MREFYKNQKIKNHLMQIFSLEQQDQLSPKKLMSEIKKKQREFLKKSEKDFKKNVILTKSINTESKGSTSFNPSVALENNLEERVMQMANRQVYKSSIGSTLLNEFERISSRPYTPTLVTYDPKEDEELVMISNPSQISSRIKKQETKNFPPLSKFPQNYSSSGTLKVRRSLVDRTSTFTQPKNSIVVVDSEPRLSLGEGNFVKLKRPESRKSEQRYRS